MRPHADPGLNRRTLRCRRRSMVTAGRSSKASAFMLVLQVAAFGPAMCQAAEPPLIADLRRGETELREMSSNVQGDFRVFRSETPEPRAFEELPSEIGVPLIRRGTLWRSQVRFRADYRSISRADQGVTEFQHSLAVDGQKVYEFASGLDPDTGLLHVYERNSPEGTALLQSIESKFYAPIDALWSQGGGIPFADLLQRPGSELVPSQDVPGALSLFASADDGTKARFDFQPGDYHPLSHFYTSVRADGSEVNWERRVSPVEKDGVLIPARVVDVARFGPGSGYTQIVMFNLAPLEDDSPIAQPITSASFRNLGAGYQVYNFDSSPNEQLAERYAKPPASDSGRLSNSRMYFLWLNGFLILALVVMILYRYVRNKKVS